MGRTSVGRISQVRLNRTSVGRTFQVRLGCPDYESARARSRRRRLPSTSIACIPNTEPPLDTQAQVEFVKHQAVLADQCNVYGVACVGVVRACL